MNDVSLAGYLLMKFVNITKPLQTWGKSDKKKKKHNKLIEISQSVGAYMTRLDTHPT